MTKKRFIIDNDMNFNNKVETYELNCIRDNENQTFYFIADSIENVQLFVKRLNELNEENEQLKSTIAQLIEQNRKNNDLLLSDIRILEKALWCGGCENDYGRLKELRKEFVR